MGKELIVRDTRLQAVYRINPSKYGFDDQLAQWPAHNTSFE